MTKEKAAPANAYRSACGDVIYLVGCALNGTRPDAGRIAEMDLPAVLRAASRHNLAAAAAMALEDAGVRNEAFAGAKDRAIRKLMLMDAAERQLFARMEAEGIWFLPLKGAVLKDYYPVYGMREMADRDILADPSRAGDVKAIMEDMGFTTEAFGRSNHDIYHRAPVLNFEIHRALFGKGSGRLHDYYGNVRERLLGDGCRKHLSAEDFYLYVTAHEYKHYASGGTGLRSLADTYVFLKREMLSMPSVEAEAGKLGIGDFERDNRRLSLDLFGGRTLDAREREMLEYILSSGTYGTYLHQVHNRMRLNRWGRLRYAWDRFRVPVSRKDRDYEAYAGTYPLFYKYKILLPLLPFYRIACAIAAGRFGAEARALAAKESEKM